jgi:ribosome-binding factor A
MASPRRRERLASIIEEVVSELLQREIQDPRVSGMTTITRVEVTADVRQAKIFVSVMGDEAARRDTLRALEHAAGFIRSKLGEELTIRHVPAITFQLDRSLEQGDRVLALLNEMAATVGPDPAAAATPGAPAGAPDSAAGTERA